MLLFLCANVDGIVEKIIWTLLLSYVLWRLVIIYSAECILVLDKMPLINIISGWLFNYILFFIFFWFIVRDLVFRIIKFLMLLLVSKFFVSRHLHLICLVRSNLKLFLQPLYFILLLIWSFNFLLELIYLLFSKFSSLLHQVFSFF